MRVSLRMSQKQEVIALGWITVMASRMHGRCVDDLGDPNIRLSPPRFQCSVRMCGCLRANNFGSSTQRIINAAAYLLNALASACAQHLRVFRGINDASAIMQHKRRIYYTHTQNTFAMMYNTFGVSPRVRCHHDRH